MASKFKERLAAMKGNYEASQGAYDQMFGGVDIPEGVYEGRLQSAKLTESKTSHKLMVRREHLITDGEYKGMVAWDNMMLETPNGLVYIRRWIELMGYQCPSVDEFEDQLEPTIEAIVNESPDVKLQITRDGDFTNVAIIELLGTNEGGAEQPADTGASKSSEDTYQGVGAKQLYAVCVAEGVDLEKVDTDNAAQLVSAMSAYDWEAANLEPGSLEVMQAVGIEVKGAPEEPGEDDELRQRLVQFCTAQDVKYEDSDDVEMLKERIDGFEYVEDEITDPEKNLLIEIGQEGNIVKAQKKAPPKKNAPAKSAHPKKGAKKAPQKKA